jgi:hypothetical protein
MKSFHVFLLEREMAYDLALKTLGLKAGFTAAELDAAHKVLLKKYHPDRNPGDKEAAEKMALANAARDALKGRSSGTAGSYTRETPEQRADTEAKWKAYHEVALNAFAERFNAETFQQHFATIFGEPFTKTSRVLPFGASAYDHAVQARMEWANLSKTIVLEMQVYISLNQLMNSKALSNPEAFLKMSITTEILNNRKKVKLTARDWQMSSEGKVLSNPETLFPAAKLKTQSAKSATRKMAKRDILLTFEKELGATVSSGKDIWVYVPVGDCKIALWRTMFMKSGSWGINAVWDKTKHEQVRVKSIAFFYESEPVMHWLWNELKAIQQHPPATAQAIAAKVDEMVELYKSKRDEFKDT